MTRLPESTGCISTQVSFSYQFGKLIFFHKIQMPFYNSILLNLFLFLPNASKPDKSSVIFLWFLICCIMLRKTFLYQDYKSRIHSSVSMYFSKQLRFSILVRVWRFPLPPSRLCWSIVRSSCPHRLTEHLFPSPDLRSPPFYLPAPKPSLLQGPNACHIFLPSKANAPRFSSHSMLLTALLCICPHCPHIICSDVKRTVKVRVLSREGRPVRRWLPTQWRGTRFYSRTCLTCTSETYSYCMSHTALWVC